MTRECCQVNSVSIVTRKQDSKNLNVIYYLLSYTVNYNIFRLAVCPTCFHIYNVIFRGICFDVTNEILAQVVRV
jgi:hypothetical protein